MLASRPVPAHPALLALAAFFATTPPPSPARAACPNPLTVVDRAIAQDRVQIKKPNGMTEQYTYWQVDYRLRHDGSAGMIVTPDELSAKVRGWVSNSRVASHATPRQAIHSLSGASGMTTFAEVIDAADDATRCRERAVMRVWVDEGSPIPPMFESIELSCEKPKDKLKENDQDQDKESPILSIAPGAIVRVRLRLEHRHFLHGAYDGLLGVRTLDLSLGSAALRDTLPMDRERRIPRTPLTWPRPPADRLDPRQYVSAPDSLHLEAHVANNHQYRFEDQPIRHATKMRLRYWYLIAPGTQGEVRARYVQYKDAPASWKVLSDGCHDESLMVVGRWVRVERIFRTEPDATSLALDFRIAGADVGEVWIDDISLEPVGADSQGP